MHLTLIVGNPKFEGEMFSHQSKVPLAVNINRTNRLISNLSSILPKLGIESPIAVAPNGIFIQYILKPVDSREFFNKELF